MKYRYYILIAFLTLTINATGQDEKHPSFLMADSSWGSEIITFPVDWAPGMTLKGYEELRFAPEWSDPKSDEFWTLVLGWNVTASSPLSLKEIEENLYHYYDGLMQPNHWSSEFPAPVVTLQQVFKDEDTLSYEGSVKIFDGFHTGKQIQLNIRATQKYEMSSSRAYVVIRFSKQLFNHQIWEYLDSIIIK